MYTYLKFTRPGRDSRWMRRARVALGTCVLVTSAAGCDSNARSHSDAPRQVANQRLDESPYYYRLGKRVDVRVPLDRLGLIATGPGLREAVAKLAGRYGLKLAAVHQDSFYVLTLGEVVERAKLELLADELKRAREAKRLISETGLIMFESKKEEPILLPSHFIARFDSGMSPKEVEEFNAKYGVEIVGRDFYANNQYLLRMKPGSELGVLEVAAVYEEDARVEFAHPNFWKLHTTFEQTPFDPFFSSQWHHRNTGASAGLVDADADTSWAWDFGYGSSNVVIAVVDVGVEHEHPDLSTNMYANPGEIAGNGIDDDGNGLIDDVSGWDFQGCGSSPLPCGDNDSNPAGASDNHGTAVAGVAAARANNATGVVGSCPNCRIMPLRVHFPTLSDQTIINVFEYAASMGVDIVNNSWGHTFPTASVSTAVATAISDAAAAGSMIVFAAGNGDYDEWCLASFPSLNDSVMAVSSSTNLDRKVTEAAWGSCVDVLAPSHRGYEPPYMGTLNVTTTDRVGTTGYNNASPPPLTCAIAEPTNTDYTHCFGGTSSAAPLVAGIAGLIRSVNPSLSRTEIQRLIQDTADKIVDSVADYHADTGRSVTQTHAWGRVNAHEAVRVAALAGSGARAGVDVFFRDNHLDWGNTTGYLGEQSSRVLFESPRSTIGHWVSRDIKVDAPPYATPPTASTYDAFVDEKPSLQPGDVNKIYVRVRNRGPQTANEVTVKLMWTQFGTSLPAFPSDFWTAFPNDSASATNPWTSAVCQGTGIPYCNIENLAYSGASVAGSSADAAQIAVLDMPAPTYDPTKANHYCLLAIADASNDPVDPISKGIFAADSVTPNDNNVTHRNYLNLDTSVTNYFDVPFFVRNPFEKGARTRVLLTGDPRLLKAIEYKTEGFTFNEPFSMKGFEERLVKLHIHVLADVEGELFISQQNYQQKDYQTIGGFTLKIAPSKRSK